MNLPFTVTQEQPIFRDSNGSFSIEVKNISDDVLLVKVLACKTITNNVYFNQSLFTIRAKQMEKIIGKYTPCQEQVPRLQFQAIEIGDQDPVLYDVLPEARKKAWDQNVNIAKENRKFYEMQMPITLVDGQKLQQGNEDSQQTLKDKLIRLHSEISQKEGEIQKKNLEIFTHVQVLNRDQAILSQQKNAIQKGSNEIRKRQSVFNIKYTHIIGICTILLGFYVGRQLK